MTKKPHPRDVKDRADALAAVATATAFTVFYRQGPASKHVERVASFADAVAVYRQLLAGAQFGRKPMIYAHPTEHEQVLIPADLIETQQEPTMTKLSDDLAARLAGKAAPAPVAAKAAKAKAPAKAAAKKADARTPVEKALAGEMPPEPTPTKVARQPAAKPAKAAKAEAPAKPAASPKPAQEVKPLPKASAKVQAILDAAAKGVMPATPDFSKTTHAGHRKHLANVVALAKAGDVAGLEAYFINPRGSSSILLARYRLGCVLALKAKGKGR